MRSPPASRAPLEFNMTSMIDITFLLIIFFITSSHLAQQETTVEVSLPSAASGRNELERPARRVTINVLPGGTLLLGSDAVEVTELERRLRFERLAEQRGNDSLEVRIRADREVPYGVIEPLLLSCSQAGIWNVTFAVVQPTP